MYKLNLKIPRFYFLFFASLLILSACGKKDRLDVDISDINVDVKIKRFERDLQSAYNKGKDEVNNLADDYPVFFDFFNINLINVGVSSDSSYFPRLVEFMEYYLVKEAFIEVDKVFSNNEYIKSKLNSAFRYYKYYYPENEIPEIITYISGFNLSVAGTGSILAISLDKYLGNDYELYRSMGFNNYSIPNMKKERIAPDCMQALAYGLFPFEEQKGNLLEYMIYEGKIQYFIEAMMPFESEAIIMGYSDKQIEWCKNNEKNMWNYLLDYKQLFETDKMKIKKYVGEGPFTINFSKESPGKAGVWIGWQLIRKYMEKNPETSLNSLMINDDFQSVLNNSGYNP